MGVAGGVGGGGEVDGEGGDGEEEGGLVVADRHELALRRRSRRTRNIEPQTRRLLITTRHVRR